MAKDWAGSSRRNAPRIERKIIEKNRRIGMKILCSDLLSLLPDYTSKERLTVADKIGEATEYIKSMNLKLENIKQKKESLLRRKRSQPCITTNHRNQPLLEVQEMGPNLDVVIANEVEGYSMFHGLIKFLHQHGFVIANANFSAHGNSTIQVLHRKVGDSKLSATTIMSRKVKEMICRTSNSTVEMEPLQSNSCDTETESFYDIWGFEIPEAPDHIYRNVGFCEEFQAGCLNK